MSASDVRLRATFKVLHYNELLIRGLMRRGASIDDIIKAVQRKRVTHFQRAMRAVCLEDARAMRPPVLTHEGERIR